MSNSLSIGIDIWRGERIYQEFKPKNTSLKTIDLEFRLGGADFSKNHGCWFSKTKNYKIPKKCLLGLVADEINVSPNGIKQEIKEALQSGIFTKKLHYAPTWRFFFTSDYEEMATRILNRSDGYCQKDDPKFSLKGPRRHAAWALENFESRPNPESCCVENYSRSIRRPPGSALFTAHVKLIPGFLSF